MSECKQYMVLYTTRRTCPGDNPFGLRVYAESSDGAIELVLGVVPDAEKLRAFEAETYAEALQLYWENEDEF